MNEDLLPSEHEMFNWLNTFLLLTIDCVTTKMFLSSRTKVVQQQQKQQNLLQNDVMQGKVNSEG